MTVTFPPECDSAMNDEGAAGMRQRGGGVVQCGTKGGGRGGAEEQCIAEGGGSSGSTSPCVPYCTPLSFNLDGKREK